MLVPRRFTHVKWKGLRLPGGREEKLCIELVRFVGGNPALEDVRVVRARREGKCLDPTSPIDADHRLQGFRSWRECQAHALPLRSVDDFKEP